MNKEKEFIVKVSTDISEAVKNIGELEELIRCQNCQFNYAGENEMDSWNRCRLHSINTDYDNYCSWGVKKNECKSN